MLHLYFALLLTAANPLPQHTFVKDAAKTSKEKGPLRVYQTPNEAGSLTVSSAIDALQFYLFDIEGKLVYQSRIGRHERQTVEGLPPGAYTYHAFRADEKLKGGIVAIKN